MVITGRECEADHHATRLTIQLRTARPPLCINTNTNTNTNINIDINMRIPSYLPTCLLTLGTCLRAYI